MGLFSKKKKVPVHVPPVGPIIVSRGQFVRVMRVRKSGGDYLNKVGMPLGLVAFDNAYTEALRDMAPTGFWKYGHAGVAGAGPLKFSDEASLDTFFATLMDGLFEFDVKKINERSTYVGTLKTDALSGALHTKLLANTETEANY